MIPARYLHTLYPSDFDEALLFVLPRCASILMPKESLPAFNSGDIPNDTARKLAEAGFLVKDHDSEKDNVFGLIDQLNRINPVVRVSVILNLVCNFACKYCYEGSQKGEDRMDSATADLLIACLKERFRPTHKTKMILDLYGGEPLLSIPMIKYLGTKLKPWVENRGGSFEFTLVTNGSLLNRSTVEDLAGFGLSRARVTIDGPPENHNRYRPFKNGRDSYEVIIKNIAEVCDLIKISIGGNFTRDNYHKFPELLDDLQSRGLTPDRLLQVKFTQVTKTNDEFSPKFNEGCCSIDEPWLADAVLLLREEILKRGYQTPRPAPNICMIDVEDSFVTHFDGCIYKCPGLIGIDRFKAGDLKNGLDDYRETYALDNWRREYKCRECGYLPLCFGGCRYARYQRTGTMQGVECMRDHYDKTLETMLIQDLKYRRKITGTTS
jgi:uncharacterized protein